MSKLRKKLDIEESSLESELVDSEKIDIDSFSNKAEEESKKFAAPPPPLDESPLLNTARKYVEHSAPLGGIKDNINSSGTHTGTDSFEYNDTSSPIPPQVKLENNNPDFNRDPLLDPPPVHKGVTPDMIQLPGDSVKEASNHLADFIIDAYQRFAPEGGFYFAKINTKEIKKLEDSGELQFGAYQEVVAYNKEIKAKLEETAKQDTKYIKKHLRTVLEVRNVSASPETMLALAVIAVVVGQAILIYNLKQDSKMLMNRIMSKVGQRRESSSKEEVPFAEVETI